MKRTLIIYGTRNGTSEITASVIAETLIIKHGHAVELTSIQRIRRYRRHLHEFDNIIVGSSIISGKWVRRVLRFLRKYDLSNHKVALFIIAGKTLNKAVKSELSKNEAIDEAISNYIEVYTNDFKFMPVSKIAFGGVLKDGDKIINSWNRNDIESWTMHLGTLLN
jgi:menaquinone-dependent protoporphyrinogen IX oxidase